MNPPMVHAPPLMDTLGHSGGGGAALALSGPPETREEEKRKRCTNEARRAQMRSGSEACTNEAD